ncbi:MAG: hypothetical protein ACREVW_04985, partial [Burkholderiales bacterium]
MKRILLGFVMLLTCATAMGANYTIGCSACGNSAGGNTDNTLNALRDFNGGFELGNGWKIGQTVQVNGSDGSNGVYKKYTNYSTIQYGCVSSCGPGDNNEAFLPPTSSGGGGGG